MKKMINAVLCAALLSALAGCKSTSQTSARDDKQTSSVTDVLEAGMAEADEEKTEESVPTAETENSNIDKPISEIIVTTMTPEPEPSQETETEPAAETAVPESAASAYENIDIDLTILSATMVYSEVSNIMAAPEDYVGKIVKMRGLFTVFPDQLNEKYYFGCLIQDATACCAQGIEFVLKGDHQYPEDYPAEGEEITVVGVFDTYIEGNCLYCTLREAEFTD